MVLKAGAFFLGLGAVMVVIPWYMIHRQRKIMEEGAIEEYIDMEAQELGTKLLIIGGFSFIFAGLCAILYYFRQNSNF